MSTAAKVGRLFRYRDADGKVCEVWVEAALARTLDSMERGYRRREAKWHKTHVAATDLARKGAKSRLIAEALGRGTAGLRKSQLGNPWEGPRFEYSRLVGESRTWKGEPVVRGWCTFCNRVRLTIGEYCLGCDRSGRDLVIPIPTAADIKRLGRYRPKDDGLRGGKSS